MKTEKIVFEKDNKQVIQQGNYFFTRVLEDEEFFESGDFNTLEKAKQSLNIVPTMEENNKIIAEFMKCENPQAWEDDLYSSDWNWLMEVVKKIRLFHNGTEPLNNNQIEQLITLIKKLNEALTLRNNVSIQAVYNGCLGFIKWYNEQTK